MNQLKFVADSMLGTLARRLRMLGIDTLYMRDADDGELKYLVRSQDRILLTRDRELAGSMKDSAWLVRGKDVRGEFSSISHQLAAVSSELKPFSRCLECNSPLETVGRDEVRKKVPPYVLAQGKGFNHCFQCGKAYWKGTHSSRMLGEVRWMEKQLSLK